MKYLLLSVSLFLVSVSVAWAQADDDTFRVRIAGAIDDTPPTTPTLLAVDPIAFNQIDLNWSSSTDDVNVSGYNVIRDGSPIATTSQLSYSDTGLNASTTYSYEVRAFDGSDNYSSTSNSIATTTLKEPPPPATTTDDGTNIGTVARAVLENISTETGFSTTSIQVETVRPARLELRWGRTGSYELGYVVSSVYKKEHSFLIADLEPGTTYEYELVGYSPRGNARVLKVGSFTTLGEEFNFLPSNVGRFTAVAREDDVDLSWIVPTAGDFSHVRIVRSHFGFPEHPSDGAVVYQGGASETVDGGVLAQYSPLYYTAFVYDQHGNVSSGAVAIVFAESGSTTDSEGAVEEPSMSDEATSTIDHDRITPEMKIPSASEITVSQNDTKFSLLDVPIYLEIAQPFTVSIPKETIAGNLKSIIVTVLDPSDTRNSYSYLLRINKDRSAYVATIPAIPAAGRSQIKVDIYDYEAFIVASYQTPLEFATYTTEKGWGLTAFIFNNALYLVFSGLLLLAVLGWFLVVKRFNHLD